MKSRTIACHALRLAATVAVGATLTSGALAQDKITIKFADWLPVGHFTVDNGAKVFMEKATELSGGELQFEYYPSQQLGKAADFLTLTQTGVADMVNLPPAYISEKFSLSSVAELPDMYDLPCEGALAFKQLASGDGIIAKNEYEPNGIRVLAALTQDAFRVVTVSKLIDEVSDFQGMKIRTGGATFDMVANQLGAVPVRIPGPDVLASVSRGTVDGAMWTATGVRSFDMQTAIKHITTDVNFGNFIMVYAVGDRVWNSLSNRQRQALTEAGEIATRSSCEFATAQERDELATIDGLGVKGNTLAAGQAELLGKELAAVQDAWAKRLDDLGRPGSGVLSAFREATKK